jgi:hypothetical protein
MDFIPWTGAVLTATSESVNLCAVFMGLLITVVNSFRGVSLMSKGGKEMQYHKCCSIRWNYESKPLLQKKIPKLLKFFLAHGEIK